MKKKKKEEEQNWMNEQANLKNDGTSLEQYSNNSCLKRMTNRMLLIEDLNSFDRIQIFSLSLCL